MKLLNILSLIIMSIIMVSCYYPPEDDLFVTTDSDLVIESKITNSKKTKNYVKLSKTVDGNSDVNYIPVPNANVFLKNITLNKLEKLKYTDDGVYICEKMYMPTNHKYKLEVDYNNLTYSSTENMPSAPKIKLLSIIYKDSSVTTLSGHYFYFALKKDTNKTSFYKVEISINDTLQNNYDDLFIFTDRMYGKNQVIKLPYIFEVKDKLKVKVEFLSINESVYNYFYALSTQTSSLYSNISPPSVNPTNNLPLGILGCFNVASSYVLDTIIFSDKEKLY